MFAMAVNGMTVEDKSVPNSATKVSFSTIIILSVSAHSDLDSVVRIFVGLVRFDINFNII